ncbi:MAG: 5'-methylthioadenosine/adenosylhomocysteine nucleosidase [Lachnospiraceae bacterium]|nr:5'-methylthioadenosine/adenosylhomocysteine nucleosidase [Lachnospiraceae bacterium]
MIGIITATQQEFEVLNRLLGTGEQGRMRFITGTLGNTEVAGVQAGIGKVNAALCAQKLIDTYPVDAIINVGVAGALDPALHVGDMVISADALQHDFDTTYFGDEPGQITGFNSIEFKADKDLVELAEKAAKALDFRYKVGRILSGDQFICDTAKKDWLVSQFAGDCTEMEGAAIAQVCTVNAIPFVILRAISDGADDGAGMSYDRFVVYAAERAAALLKEML